MRCPKCHTETPGNALYCPGCKLPTPLGKTKIKERKKKKRELFAAKPKKIFKTRKSIRIKPWVAIVASVGSVLVVGAASYFISISMLQSTEVKPSPAHVALEKLRKMPSSRPGVTVDEFLNEELEKVRAAGRLREAEGWGVTPGQTEGEFLISFSYEEQDAEQKRAEWIVNPARNIIHAQNEMAKLVYNH
jgi:hypothetical protein